MNAKRYGDETTHLHLTGDALRCYNSTDPLIILEHVENNDQGEETFTYTMDGCVVIYEPVSEQELISILCDLQRETPDDL